MNALTERVAQLIGMQGPISVSQFMTMALHDPTLGYYATHDPIGAGGDFITAPEISQMFGELLGLWCVQAWRDQGSPSPARLVELGPGHGTLMADALRAARLDPEFLASIEVVLLEASVGLRKQQATSLETARCPVPVRWVHHLDETLSDRPLFLLANEFFDALPIRQSVLTERGWCERMVVADGQGGLAFAASPVATMLAIPSQRGLPEAGAIFETSPAAEAIVAQIAHIIVDKGGAALIVDYGYGADSGFAETLQAITEHKFTNVLDNPGEADLSAHVDFGALARVAVDAGAKAYGPIEQGEFLSALGIVARAERLSRNHLQSVERQLNRLLGAEEMGTLFKALAIMPKHAPVPAGF